MPEQLVCVAPMWLLLRRCIHTVGRRVVRVSCRAEDLVQLKRFGGAVVVLIVVDDPKPAITSVRGRWRSALALPISLHNYLASPEQNFVETKRSLWLCLDDFSFAPSACC